jgi:hypothetical protein
MNLPEYQAGRCQLGARAASQLVQCGAQAGAVRAREPHLVVEVAGHVPGDEDGRHRLQVLLEQLA